MKGNNRNNDEVSKIRKKLEEIEKLIYTTHIVTERYSNNKNGCVSNTRVEIYR